MSKTNRKCLNCGEEYYVCRHCISINSWKNICCSQDCFREYMSGEQSNVKANETKTWEDIEMNIIMRGCLNNDKTIDIVAYDEDLGRIDCTDGITKTLDDFRYFVVPKEEMMDIFERIKELKKQKRSSRKQKQNVNDDTL